MASLVVLPDATPVSADDQPTNTWMGTVMITTHRTSANTFDTFDELVTVTYTIPPSGPGSYSATATLHATRDGVCSLVSPPVTGTHTTSGFATGSGAGHISVTFGSGTYLVQAGGAAPSGIVDNQGLTFTGFEDTPCEASGERQVYSATVPTGGAEVAGTAQQQAIAGGSSFSSDVMSTTISFAMVRTTCDESVDTDGDGFSDCEEHRQGTDPKDPTSYPGAGNGNGDGENNGEDNGNDEGNGENNGNGNGNGNDEDNGNGENNGNGNDEGNGGPTPDPPLFPNGWGLPDDPCTANFTSRECFDARWPILQQAIAGCKAVTGVVPFQCPLGALAILVEAEFCRFHLENDPDRSMEARCSSPPSRAHSDPPPGRGPAR